MMIARVATFTPLPDGLDEDAVALLRRTIREAPGYVAGFHLLDPGSNKAMSVTVYDSRESLRSAGEALAARPAQRKVGIDPDRVEFFEATCF